MFNKVKELLESDSITKEVAEAIDSEITSALTTLRDENKTLRTEKETLSKSYDEVLKSKSDLDTQLSGLDDKIAQARKDGQGELVTQLESEKESKAELQKSLDNLQKSNNGLRLDSAVSTALKSFDIIDAHKDTTEFMLRSRVSFNDKGEMIYADSGNESNVEDGLKGYFESNQGKLNPKGDGGGSGAHGGSGGGGANTMERVAFEKLDAGGRAKFMADGGKLK